jgi:hypothetical protein
MAGRLRVFISSSPGELTDEREAASAAIRTLRLTPVVEELVEPDVFVGLYWQRYGWKSDAATSSVVEDEYVRSGNVPRLVYVKEPAPDRDPELEALLGGMPSRRSFASPGELAELLLDDLAALLSQRFYGGRTPVHDLPEGTVSLLFADLDGSTPIVRLLGDAYPGGVGRLRGHRGAPCCPDRSGGERRPDPGLPRDGRSHRRAARRRGGRPRLLLAEGARPRRAAPAAQRRRPRARSAAAAGTRRKLRQASHASEPAGGP